MNKYFKYVSLIFLTGVVCLSSAWGQQIVSREDYQITYLNGNKYNTNNKNEPVCAKVSEPKRLTDLCYVNFQSQECKTNKAGVEGWQLEFGPICGYDGECKFNKDLTSTLTIKINNQTKDKNILKSIVPICIAGANSCTIGCEKDVVSRFEHPLCDPLPLKIKCGESGTFICKERPPAPIIDQYSCHPWQYWHAPSKKCANNFPTVTNTNTYTYTPIPPAPVVNNPNPINPSCKQIDYLRDCSDTAAGCYCPPKPPIIKPGNNNPQPTQTPGAGCLIGTAIANCCAGVNIPGVGTVTGCPL